MDVRCPPAGCGSPWAQRRWRGDDRAGVREVPRIRRIGRIDTSVSSSNGGPALDRTHGYDAIAGFYLDVSGFKLAAGGGDEDDPSTVALVELVGSVEAAVVLDLGCGAGRASRAMARRGARVVGVDASQLLIDAAQQEEAARPLGARYVCGDATTTEWWDGTRFDVVVCNQAVADMADLSVLVDGVARVLQPGGRFVFSLLHPCSPGLGADTPSAWPPERGYSAEGWWLADNPGMRGKVGSHFRRLSTYLNTLIGAGFHLERTAEPAVAAVPLLLAMAWRKTAVSGRAKRDRRAGGQAAHAPSRYDPVAAWYVEWTDRWGDGLLAPVPDEVGGQRVLDVAAGHGRASRALAQLGALVTAVELAPSLVAEGRRREHAQRLGINYLQGDAATLDWWDGEAFDGVVAEMALMDIDDLAGVVLSVSTVLAPGGWFACSLFHPCFPGGPGSADGLPSWPPDRGYHHEGWWTTDGAAVRGRVGANHRTLATYLNSVVETGLDIEYAHEPDFQTPRFLCLRARRTTN